MASKNSSANGSDRASAWIGNTPSSTPASRIRSMFSETLNQRSVAQTCTPNSRRRKIDDAARPQPRSNTRMPGRKSSAVVSHSVIQSEFAPPLTLATIHSGWYCEERGNRSETNRLSEVMCLDASQLPACSIFADEMLVRFGQVRDFHIGSVKEQPPATQTQRNRAQVECIRNG